MLMKWTVLYCCFALTKAAKLPNYFSKCEKNSPDLASCVAKSGNEVMQHLAAGDSHIRFPSLLPLKVPFMNLDIGDGLQLNLTDNEVFGLDKIHIDKVKVDLKAGKYDFYINTPKFTMLGTYDISGRILLLPIFGHGPINATFVNSKIKFSFDFDLHDVKGKVYMTPKNPRYTSKAERAYFKLDNLFNGNELLSTEMNKFMEENWKEVNDELTPPLDDVNGKLVLEILKGFMSKVPFDDMFSKPTLETQ